MVLQKAFTSAALSLPMVSALELRLQAHLSHHSMYPHDSPSRVTAQMLREAHSLHKSLRFRGLRAS